MHSCWSRCLVDIGAYAAGVTLGKHKMTPRISPNKTWEGFAGAAVAAMVAGVVITITALDQPWWIGLILGVLVLLTATGGDLTESLIKRDLNVKDMSNWIPGTRRTARPTRFTAALHCRRVRDGADPGSTIVSNTADTQSPFPLTSGRERVQA